MNLLVQPVEMEQEFTCGLCLAEESQGSRNELDVLLSMSSPLWEHEGCWMGIALRSGEVTHLMWLSGGDLELLCPFVWFDFWRLGGTGTVLTTKELQLPSGKDRCFIPKMDLGELLMVPDLKWLEGPANPSAIKVSSFLLTPCRTCLE